MTLELARAASETRIVGGFYGDAFEHSGGVTVLSATLLVATVSRVKASNHGRHSKGVENSRGCRSWPTPQTFRAAATLAIFHGKHYSRVEVHPKVPGRC
jgi:hypothetical protein